MSGPNINQVLFEIILAMFVIIVGIDLCYLKRSFSKHSRALVRDRFIDGRSPSNDKKRYIIQNIGLKIFYYLDESLIKDLYPQAIKELQPSEIITIKTDESNLGVIADLKVVKPTLLAKNNKQIKSKYKIDNPMVNMYNQIENYLFNKEDTTFALEDFQYDDKQFEEIALMFKQIREKYQIELLSEYPEKYIADKILEFALMAADNIVKVSGYIAMMSEFKVTSKTDVSTELTLDHPLNGYLDNSEERILIKAFCVNSNLKDAGKTFLTQDKIVKLVIIGKVVRWDQNERSLIVNPIAIY